MDIEELDKKIQEFTEEMREFNKTISTNQLALVHRIDTLDLNGTAAHLRMFGNFLKEHPDFMQREAAQESKRVRQEIAFEWIAETFHLTNFGGKLKWIGTAILTGVLLQFGSQLVGFISTVSSAFHILGHAAFK